MGRPARRFGPLSGAIPPLVVDKTGPERAGQTPGRLRLVGRPAFCGGARAIAPLYGLRCVDAARLRAVRRKLAGGGSAG